MKDLISDSTRVHFNVKMVLPGIWIPIMIRQSIDRLIVMIRVPLL